MNAHPTENRPPFRILEVMRQLAEGGERYPHTGWLSRQPIYPGHGYPPNPGEARPGLSPFGRLAKGQPLGKKSVLLYNADDAQDQPAAVPILRVEGDDLDATQLIITLAPPLVIPLDFADVTDGINPQIQTGEEDNQQVSGGSFPGTASPIQWPPIEAVLEWGIKGASSRAIVDITNGCSVAVVASFLNVHAVITQNEDTGEVGGTSALYVLSAFVGPGWTSSYNAKRTIHIGTVAVNAESDVFAVPLFARRAYVVGCDTSTPPNVTAGYLRFWQSPDGSASGFNVGNYFISGNQPDGFDVPNGAQYFSVYNQGAVGMRFSVIFELAIG